MRKQQIGFLGTGIMGLPMCGHLLREGHSVRVWNRTRSKAECLAREGAVLSDSAAEAAADNDVVIVMLSSGPVIDDVLFDRSGGAYSVAERLRPGGTVVVMSSIPVDTSRKHAVRLGKRDMRYVDAPVSGGEKGAVEASLTIMAGGDENVVTGVEPILSAMGRLTHVGPVGCGQLAKLANQTIVGITIDAVAEALLLVEAGGADSAAVRKALLGGFADSTILRQHGERMIEGKFEPGAKAATQLKDLETSCRLADSLGLNLPVLRLTESLFKQMCAEGGGDRDHSALYEFLRDSN